MQTVRLHKALKLKNKLAGDIAGLNERIKNENSFTQDKVKRFDVTKLVEQRSNAVAELIALKTAIAQANVKIYGAIYEMAELKAEIAFWKEVNTREGVERTGGGFGREAIEIKYECVYNEASIADIVAKKEKRIEELQDQVDQYNAVTEISF